MEGEVGMVDEMVQIEGYSMVWWKPTATNAVKGRR